MSTWAAYYEREAAGPDIDDSEDEAEPLPTCCPVCRGFGGLCNCEMDCDVDTDEPYDWSDDATDEPPCRAATHGDRNSTCTCERDRS